MTRHTGLTLLFMLPFLHVRAQEPSEKPAPKPPEVEKASTETKDKKAAISPKIYGITLMGDTLAVILSDTNTGKITSIGFEPDKDGNKLISVNVDAESKRARVVALLNGQEHTVSQQVRSRSPSSTSDSTPTRAARGPSDSDRKRYESLSETAKEKFRDKMREKFEDPAFRSGAEEERRAAIQTIFDQIQKEDQASKTKP